MPARPRAFSVTPREMQVLDLLAQGFSNEEIGVSLGVETETVKHHISQASIKLDLHSRILLAPLLVLSAFPTRRRKEMIMPDV
jgi:DNA-binding NarL/FixJ family response regulator